MTGLRDRKKKELRHRILVVAAELFAENGLDKTTMDDIAAAAEVSVGTVYNYFGTKGALLLAGIEEDTDLMLASGQQVLDNPDADPLDAIKRLSHIYLDELLRWDKRLLREVMVAVFERIGGDEITAELARQDERLIAQMIELLTYYRDRGQLAPDVEPTEAVMVLFSVFALQLFMLLNLDLQSTLLHAQIDRQLELVFAGIGRESRRE